MCAALQYHGSVITDRATKLLPLHVIILEITDDVFVTSDCLHTSYGDLFLMMPNLACFRWDFHNYIFYK